MAGIDVNHEAPLEDEDSTADGRGYWRSDKFSFVLAIVTAGALSLLVLLILVPLLDTVLGILKIQVVPLSNLRQWLFNGLAGIILAAVLAGLALLSYVLLRARLLGNPDLYVGQGCPHCNEHELIRVRRQQGDRLLARAGIPVRRYVCRNCAWGGLRIGLPLPDSEYLVSGAAADTEHVGQAAAEQPETALAQE
jgi:hypothetical protein